MHVLNLSTLNFSSYDPVHSFRFLYSCRSFSIIFHPDYLTWIFLVFSLYFAFQNVIFTVLQKMEALLPFFHQIKCCFSFPLCLVSLSQLLFYDILVLVLYWATYVYCKNSCNSLRCYFPASPICNCSFSILLLLYTTQQNKTCTCTSTSSQPRAIVHHQIILYVAVDVNIWETSCLVCYTKPPAGRMEGQLGLHVSISSSFLKKFWTF